MSFECHDCGDTITGGNGAYELSYQCGVKAILTHIRGAHADTQLEQRKSETITSVDL